MSHGTDVQRPASSRHRTRLRVEEVMTAQPLTIGRDQTLAVAHSMMRDYGIRHLPVLEHGELVGIVSERDIYLLETLAGVDIALDRVDDAMTTDTYAVSPEAAIGEVAAIMAQHRYGCAVVMERDRVIGIFTTTDALRIVAGELPPRGGHR
jgi:acetoin utilization protein AcuB